MNSSHGRAWDLLAVKGGKPYHTLYHQDCLILPQPSGHVAQTKFLEEAEEYLKLKFLKMETISFPGLNKQKLLNHDTIPGGKFKGLTVNEAVKSVNNVEISSLILGSNDANWLFKLEPEKAVKEFFKLVSVIYNGSNIKHVFIATLFPRKEFYTRPGHLKRGIQEFNNALLSAKGNRNLEIKIKNRENLEINLKFHIIDMTDIFKYNIMCNDEFFCNRSKDGIHLKGIFSERYLEKMNMEIVKFFKIKDPRFPLRPKKKN